MVKTPMTLFGGCVPALMFGQYGPPAAIGGCVGVGGTGVGAAAPPPPEPPCCGRVVGEGVGVSVGEGEGLGVGEGVRVGVFVTLLVAVAVAVAVAPLLVASVFEPSSVRSQRPSTANSTPRMPSPAQPAACRAGVEKNAWKRASTWPPRVVMGSAYTSANL
jgi:hypothetical protein